MNNEAQKTKLFGAINKIIDDQTLSREEKASLVIHATGVVCGVVALQPLPFADIMILTPLQVTMFLGLGKLFGFDVSFERAKEIVLEIIGVVGMGLIAQHSVIGLYKTVLPFAGGFFTIPLVWGFTYGMGRVGIYYFEQRHNGENPDPAEMKRAFREGRKEGVSVAKKQDSESFPNGTDHDA